VRKTKSLRAESSFIQHATQPAAALIVVPALPQQDCGAERAVDPSSRLAEAEGLARAIHLNIIGTRYYNIHRPEAATLLGKGRVAEIAETVKAAAIDLVIMDHALTPVQQRNLEKAWNCKVIDRTALILEIFGERARSKEGVLQVELAHLNYQKGRLVRSWTHLERQRGGSGFLGGPGETQIEADRRVLQDKIHRIKRDLAKIVKTRHLHRAKRKKAPYPVIALVGYTNAGKSTLFNRLTGAHAVAEDRLFATLDPTLRRIRPGGGTGETSGKAPAPGLSGQQNGPMLIISDTVGFISHLPTHLVAAFRATLEEVTEADLIVHVRDMADPDNPAHKRDVAEILAALGIETENPDRIIELWNKTDLLPPESQARLAAQAAAALLPSVPVSAQSGQGLYQALALIERKTLGAGRTDNIRLRPQEFSLLDWLYRHGVQKSRDNDENGDIILKIGLSDRDWRAFAVLRRKLAAENRAEKPVSCQGEA